MSDNEYAGKVVLITGAARGQGRSHALAYAKAGADLIICDRCEDSAALGYPLGAEADLKETVRQIEALGRRCVSVKLNTADRAGLDALVARGRPSSAAASTSPSPTPGSRPPPRWQITPRRCGTR